MAANQRQTVEGIRYRVHEVTTLGWSNDGDARKLLDRAVGYATRILQNHKWSVMLVGEFYPRDQRLLGLNVNHGEHIKVRLRRPTNRDQFLPFEEIMCTLLHELVHNTIGPHNKAFYALYYELVRECELLQVQDLQRQGAVIPRATPFQAREGNPGRVLGGRAVTGESYDAIRARVLAAVERRLSAAADAVAGQDCCASQDNRLLESSIARGQHLDRDPPKFPPIAPAPTCWVCAHCTFLNNPLLPYCEMCCANDDDSAGRERAAAASGSNSSPPALPQKAAKLDHPRSGRDAAHAILVDD